jgi:hypothetical protein
MICRKARSNSQRTYIREVPKEDVDRAVAIPRTAMPSPGSVPDARFADVENSGRRPLDKLVGELFRSQLVHTADFQQIKSRAEKDLADMVAYVGEDETRKHWPALPPARVGARKGARDPVYDVLLEGRYNALRREYPGSSECKLIESLKQEFKQEDASHGIARHLERIRRRGQQ